MIPAMLFILFIAGVGMVGFGWQHFQISGLVMMIAACMSGTFYWRKI